MSSPRPAPVKPKPLHYEFFTTVAVAIYEAALTKGATKKGAIFVISHASLESGFARSAIRYGDYNLFGQMTRGSDSKRSTSDGKLKDFSGAGGYAGSMAYYFSRINMNQWTGLDLIQKADFKAKDIDEAFNTGHDYPSDKERHGGKYAYDNNPDTENSYGTKLYRQMGTTKTRMVAALEYKIDSNNAEIRAIDAPQPPAQPQRPSASGRNPYRTAPANTNPNQRFPGSSLPVAAPQDTQRKAALQSENGKLRSLIADIRTVIL